MPIETRNRRISENTNAVKDIQVTPQRLELPRRG